LVSPTQGGGLKGNPVKIRSYPRSCKPLSPEGDLEQPGHLTTVPHKAGREGDQSWGEPEDLPD